MLIMIDRKTILNTETDGVYTHASIKGKGRLTIFGGLGNTQLAPANVTPKVWEQILNQCVNYRHQSTDE